MLYIYSLTEEREREKYSYENKIERIEKKREKMGVTFIYSDHGRER